MIFFDTCQLNVSGENANIHMRSDTKNKETTARTIHLPEQKEPSVWSLCRDKKLVHKVLMIFFLFQSKKMFDRLLHESFSKGGQFDYCGKDMKIVRCWHPRVMFTILQQMEQYVEYT